MTAQTPPPLPKPGPTDASGSAPAFDEDATRVVNELPPGIASGMERTMLLRPGAAGMPSDEATAAAPAATPRTITQPLAPRRAAASAAAPASEAAPRAEPAAPTRSDAGPPSGFTSLPHAPSSAPSAGQADGQLRRVGRYQILEKLGRGGMATVFKAHDPGIGRDVAIKFLHASLCEDETCRLRFLREAGAAGRLSHPNIAIVHDVGEIDGRPYMAMELLTGKTLAEELEKKKVLPVRDVVQIGIELAKSLDYAHGKGIVHRDIKPANIMRASDGSSIKVTDFGIAHIDNPNDDSTDRTRVGDILGTPQYMSPEQARGDKIDGRSDLFSAGIVLYQMLAGVRPFRGDSLVVVATKIANEEAVPVDKLRPEVPSALRRVIDRCLAKQPENRFQSGAEMAAALVKVLHDIDEASLSKNRPRIVPLRVKWAVTMAAIVAVVMGITATVIIQRQQAAMMSQVSDYGASLARFIAAQNAAGVLGEDWDAVEVAVGEIMKTRNFERVVVIDMGGTVRVSSVAGQAGQPYRAATSESLARLGNTSATRYEANGESVLGFEAPITFQDKRVGQVALGIPEKPLTQVARLSMTLMAILALVTVLAVAIAMYFVADWFAKPVRLLSESMAEIAKGRFDHRIGEKRKDEFGQLYEMFDAMAAALQARQEALRGTDGATGSPTVFGRTQATRATSAPASSDAAPQAGQAPATPAGQPPVAG